MALFQTAVLKNYQKAQKSDAIKKAYSNYTKYFLNPTIQENIRSSKEEEFQGIFLTELFVKILGYTMKPNADFNLVAEYKNESNSKKADGAILLNDQAIGVIELKGTNTKDLEKIRQQAFDYKANQSECVYVITSNYEKLRFYINNAVDFEEFDLFNLTEERFSLLHLCLAKENLLNNIPLKIKEASLQEEEQITKKFYAAYSLFKRELFRDLVKLNMKNDVFRSEMNRDDADRAVKNIKQTLFKKSQKLIDRFLFVFFAEDRDLLPANSTKQILNKWKSDVDFGDERPIYDLFKQYFNFLDTGRKGTASRQEIFAYNGGLFKPDAVLDSLLISNELIVKHTDVLQSYDFESQVDVNILGHIFENSLNEIESVNAEIEGVDFDKQKTKRKKDGVFYTPKYITKYIVDNTVGKLCAEKKAEIGIKEEDYLKSRKGRAINKLRDLQERLDAYRTWLLNITICDPACGSGAFLNQALDFLIKEHTYIDELQTSMMGGGMVFPDIENTILENNIFGVDLNEESVEIAKLSLWLRTAQPRRKLNDLNSNIKCGNSLIDSKAVAGDKAFSWEKEFPQVFKDKDKTAYHIVTAAHDSRTSQRMIDFKVRELRDHGTRPTAEGIWLTAEDELNIAKTVTEIVEEDQLNVMGFNICGDHMHLLLVCEQEELTKIVGKIKGKTARVYNANKGIHPLVNKGEEKAVSLWAQKFGKKEITSEEQLWNTVNYIKTNRSKHELPEHKELDKVCRRLFASYEHAFRTEKKGGFDVVIGNPPYGAKFSNEEIIYYNKVFSHQSYQLDSYLLFTENAKDWLKNGGMLGYIMPNTWLSSLFGTSIRKFVFSSFRLVKLVHYNYFVFYDATVETDTYIFKNVSINSGSSFELSIVEKNGEKKDLSISQKDWKELDGEPINIYQSKEALILKTKFSALRKLGDITQIVQGTKPFQKGKGNPKQTEETMLLKPFVADYKKDESFVPLLRGSLMNKYINYWNNDYWISFGDWLAEPRYSAKFNSNEKIVIRQTGDSLIATYDDEQFVVRDNLYVIRDDANKLNLKGLLGVLNSNLMNWYFQNIINPERGKAMAQVKRGHLQILPIVNNNFDVLEDAVGKILELSMILMKSSSNFLKFIENLIDKIEFSQKLECWHELDFGEFIKELNKAIKKENKQRAHQGDSSPSNSTGNIPELTKLQEMEWMEVFETKKAEAQALKAEIDKTDKAIDAMVYELYGLTDDEIAIVESSN
jgi:type I restriction-modification system DNA methylase subunit